MPATAIFSSLPWPKLVHIGYTVTLQVQTEPPHVPEFRRPHEVQSLTVENDGEVASDSSSKLDVLPKWRHCRARSRRLSSCTRTYDPTNTGSAKFSSNALLLTTSQCFWADSDQNALSHSVYSPLYEVLPPSVPKANEASRQGSNFPLHNSTDGGVTFRRRPVWSPDSGLCSVQCTWYLVKMQFGWELLCARKVSRVRARRLRVLYILR